MDGIFRPCIVAGGQVVGTWKRTLEKRAVDIALDPFAPGVISTDEVRDAARRFGDFLGLPVSSVGTTEGRESSRASKVGPSSVARPPGIWARIC